MKRITLIAGTLIALLNALVFAPAMSAYASYLTAVSLALAVWLTLRALVHKESVGKSETPAPSAAPAKTQPLPQSSAEAEVIAVLGALQSKGRFVDFLMDDIARYSDAQVGAAARVVHQGCKAAMNDFFTIEPVATEAEGSRVTVPAEAGESYRLTGTVLGDGPHSGTLAHKGWKATRVNLPRVIKVEDGRLPPIVPAQVEVG